MGRFHFADVSHPIQAVGVAFIAALLLWIAFVAKRPR